MLLAQHMHPLHPLNDGRWLSGHLLSMPSLHALSKDGQVAHQGTRLTRLPKLLEKSAYQGQVASAWRRAQARHRHCPTHFFRMAHAARLEPGGSVLAVLGSPALLGDGFCNKICGVWAAHRLGALTHLCGKAKNRQLCP